MAMKREDYLGWLEDLLRRSRTIKRCESERQINSYDEQEAHEWISEAEAAIHSIFPASHPICRQWRDFIQNTNPHVVRDFLPTLFGILKGRANMVRDGRLVSLIDTIRVETEDELLGQSQTLLNANYLVAATVIAGGALETHLRHLVEKHGLAAKIKGEGSITKYDGAIAQSRNEGTATVYEATDSKLVGSWGGMRNDAAHDPGSYNRSADDVRRMIEGIREFISRTAR